MEETNPKRIKLFVVPFRQFKARVRAVVNPKKVRPADLAHQRLVPDLGIDGTFTETRESIHLWRMEYGNTFMCSYMKVRPGAQNPIQLPLRVRITGADLPTEALLPVISDYVAKQLKVTHEKEHSCGPACKCVTPCKTCKCH
jgi:hypothetical protein